MKKVIGIVGCILLAGCGDGDAPLGQAQSSIWIETDIGVGYNVLDAIPDNLEAGILDRTGTVDLSSYIQSAIDQVCADSVTATSGTSADAIVAFPAGTYVIEETLVACDAVSLAGAKLRGRRGAAIVAGTNFNSPAPGSCTTGHEYDYACLRNPMVLVAGTGVINVSIVDLVFDLNNLDIDGIRVTQGHEHRVEHCTFSNIKAGQAAVRGGATMDFTFSENRTVGDGFSLDMRDINVNSSAYYGMNVGSITGNYFQATGGVRFGGSNIDFSDNWIEGTLAATSSAFVEACDNNAPGSSPVSEHRYRLTNNYFEVEMSDPPPSPLPSGFGIRACYAATITDNRIDGPGQTNNAYTGLSVPLAGSVITGNMLMQWSSCANIPNGTDQGGAGVFLANAMLDCPTYTVGSPGNFGLVQTPDGGYSLSGASTSLGVTEVSLTSGTIDAAAGSLQRLVTLTAHEITQIDNKQIGQQLCLISDNELVTLDATAFNRVYDYVLVPGEPACFIVDQDLQLQGTNLPSESVASPGDLPNLDWWLENTTSQVQVTGTNVTRWLTQAGGTNHDVLQNTTTLQPQWTGSAVDMQGSYYLAGAGAASDWSFLHQAGTLFVVFHPNSHTAGYLLGTGENANNSGLSVHYDTTYTPERLRVRVVNSSGSYATSLYTTTQAPFAHGSTYVLSLVLSSSGTATAFRDYDEVGSTALGTMSTASPAANVRIGNKVTGGGGGYFDGSVLEVIHYGSELNDRARTAVTQMLRTKHGL